MSAKLPKSIRRAGGQLVKRAQQNPNRCVACGGSGYYDDTDRRGRPIRCGSCAGTGRGR